MCNITGVKYSGLPDPDIALSDLDWVSIELTNGKIVKVHPSQIIGIIPSSGAFVGAFYFTSMGFTGTVLSVPIGINGGKLPSNVALVTVDTNGVEDYPVEDFNIQYGVGAAVDSIVFTATRTNKDILVKWQIFS